MSAVEVSAWRSRVRDDLPNVATSIVDRVVLDTCIEFCADTRIWHIRMTPMSTIANIAQYKLRVPANTKLATVIELRYEGKKLEPAIDSDLDASTPGWETKTGTPRQYTMIDQNTARLISIPTEAITNALTASLAIKPARDATTVGEVLWENWADAITHGAKYRIFSMKTQAWHNPALARMHHELYSEMKNSAKGVGMNRHTNRARRRVFAQSF